MNASIKNSFSEHEERRLSAVTRYEILDTPPDRSLDRITALAARRFSVPIAIISIVDRERVWFKSNYGMESPEVDREYGFCAAAIAGNTPFILTDAALDSRGIANPLVAGEFGLRFYAGAPLTTADGYNLGTLCLIDHAPRRFDQAQVAELEDLAAVVMDQLDMRLSARRAAAHAELMVKEIDHRVMNSLHFISTLLAMQSRAATLPEVAGQLRVAANRVAAVAHVHRNFYAEDSDEVSCVAFLRRLCADLSGIFGRKIIVDGDAGDVPTTSIQPIGLIVNELVTNAAKHGEGTITVTYRRQDGRHHLTVWDQSAGPPPGFDPQTSTGLGMRVVIALLRQMPGELATIPSPSGRGFGVVFG